MQPVQRVDDPSCMLTEEDILDWRENQTRSRSDCRRVDRNFTLGWLAAMGIWAVVLTVGGGSLGALAVMGYVFLSHHVAGI